MDTKFKGRIQLALASIFPISDKSGVNLKGSYNKNNQALNTNANSNEIQNDSIISNAKNLNQQNEINQNEKNENENTLNKLENQVNNQKFYKQFWILLKYLSNPLKIFNNEPIDSLNEIESLEEEKSEVIVLVDDIQMNKLEIFLININKVIAFFSKNKIDLTDKSEAVLTYPKYLTSPDLFDLQLNESSFRKTILLQFLIVLNSFLKPVSQIQKKNFILSDKEKKQVKETIRKINILIKSNKFNDFYFKSILNGEKTWENWKETGCSSYEKFFDENSLKDFDKIISAFEKKIQIQESQKFVPIKQKKLFNLENQQNNYDINKFLEINNNSETLKNFEVDFNYSSSIKNENPFLGDFSERVLRDMDDDLEEDMKISAVDSVIFFYFLLFYFLI